MKRVRFRSITPYVTPEHAVYETVKDLNENYLDALLDRRYEESGDEFELLVDRYILNIQSTLPPGTYMTSDAVLIPYGSREDITLDDLITCINRVSIYDLLDPSIVPPLTPGAGVERPKRQVPCEGCFFK